MQFGLPALPCFAFAALSFHLHSSVSSSWTREHFTPLHCQEPKIEVEIFDLINGTPKVLLYLDRMPSFFFDGGRLMPCSLK